MNSIVFLLTKPNNCGDVIALGFINWALIVFFLPQAAKKSGKPFKYTFIIDDLFAIGAPTIITAWRTERMLIKSTTLSIKNLLGRKFNSLHLFSKAVNSLESIWFTNLLLGNKSDKIPVYIL